MRAMMVTSAVVVMVGVTMAQSPTIAPAAGPAATQAASHPRNLDKALQEDIDLNLDKARLEDALATLRQITQTNIAVNWPALAIAGIARDTPVTLHLARVPYEEALRGLLEELPATKTRPNYLVGDNALEITTTAELGKLSVVRLYDISHVAGLSLTGEATAKQRSAHEEFLKRAVHWQLVLAGEDADAPGRELVTKDDMLAATQSRRGQLFVQHVVDLFGAPARINQAAPGTVLSVRAKKAEERMAELCGKADAAGVGQVLARIARESAKAAPDLNVALLPGTAWELAKPLPAIDYQVTSGGVVLIGPEAEMRGRVMLAVYDLGELLKRMAFRSKAKPPPELAELAGTVLGQLKDKVAPRRGGGVWGELGKLPDSMSLYEGLLVVSGSPAAQRAVTAALQELYR